MEVLNRLPDEVVRLLERGVPVFCHLAAAAKGRTPASCRVYAIRIEAGDGRLWALLLRKQWAHLHEIAQQNGQLALLITSGVDNEAYQIKGILHQFRPLVKADSELLERQKELTARTFPHLLPLHAVHPADCVAVGLAPMAVYAQTPGPQAGSLLAGRSPLS